mgnify:CR=1 FL=1
MVLGKGTEAKRQAGPAYQLGLSEIRLWACHDKMRGIVDYIECNSEYFQKVDYSGGIKGSLRYAGASMIVGKDSASLSVPAGKGKSSTPLGRTFSFNPFTALCLPTAMIFLASRT